MSAIGPKRTPQVHDLPVSCARTHMNVADIRPRLYFEISIETQFFGAYWEHSRKPRALRSAVWGIRGFSNPYVWVAWRAIAWRNTIDLCISASPSRRDVAASAPDFCVGGFRFRRQHWVFDRQDNLSCNDYPLRGEGWSHRSTHQRSWKNIFAVRPSHCRVREILPHFTSIKWDRCRRFKNDLVALPAVQCRRSSTVGWNMGFYHLFFRAHGRCRSLR